jgi:hypothetical protein
MHIKKKVFILFSISIFLLLITNNVFCQTYNIPVNGLYIDNDYDGLLEQATCLYDDNDELFYCLLDKGNYILKDSLYIDTSDFDNINPQEMSLFINQDVIITLDKDNITDNKIIIGNNNNLNNFKSIIILNAKLEINEDLYIPRNIDLISYVENIVLATEHSEFLINLNSNCLFNFVDSCEPQASNFQEDLNLTSFLYDEILSANQNPVSLFGGVLDFTYTSIYNKGLFEINLAYGSFKIQPVIYEDGAPTKNYCDPVQINASSCGNGEVGDVCYCYEYDVNLMAEEGDTDYDQHLLKVIEKKYVVENIDSSPTQESSKTKFIRLKSDDNYKIIFDSFDNNSNFIINSPPQELAIDKSKMDGDFQSYINNSRININNYSGEFLPKSIKNNNILNISTCDEFSQENYSPHLFDDYDYDVNKLYFYSPDYSSPILNYYFNTITSISTFEINNFYCSEHNFSEDEYYEEGQEGSYFYIPTNIKSNPILLATIYDYNSNSFISEGQLVNASFEKFSQPQNYEGLDFGSYENNLFFYLDDFISEPKNILDVYDINIGFDFYSDIIYSDKLLGFYKR